MSLKEAVFLKACRREKTPYTPVWLMRQAGRYMKDYRALRAKTPFLELCKDPSLAADITVDAQKALGVDAAILFSDILLILEPMGFDLAYLSGDGPSISKPVRTGSDVDALKKTAANPLPFTSDAIRRIKAALPSVPLIGFAGAPFTLASYLIEGGSSDDFTRTKDFMREDEGRWKALMDKITDSTLAHLGSQLEAGADALQLFDSWAGVLTSEEYVAYALPYSRRIFSALKGKAPLIHFGTRTGPFLESFSDVDCDVVGVDHRISLKEARKRIHAKKAVQGNLDPAVLLSDQKNIEKEVRRVLSEGGSLSYIFNLGHGVLPQTPEENVKALVRMVHELSSS